MIRPPPAWTFAGGRFGRYIARLLWPSAPSWGVGVIPAGSISSRREMGRERIREREREKTHHPRRAALLP